MNKLSFVGTYNDRHWIETGLVGLDIACGKVNPMTGEVTLGIPTRTGIHIYGTYKCGKTTSVTSLASILAEKMGGTVLHCPIDTFDDNLLEIMEYAGLTRNPHIIMEDEDAKSLDALVAKFSLPEIAVGVLDSIMAVSPTREQNGSVADSNMGVRAKMIGTWVKQMFAQVKHGKQEKIFFATNHQFDKVGSIPGKYTPGGLTLPGFTSLHIKIYQGRENDKKMGKPVTFDGKWLMKGVIENANFGGKGKLFNLFLIGGLGIHKGLTAMYDCLSYGVAVDSRKVITIEGERIGKVSELVEAWKDDTVFEPFHKALQERKMELAQGKISAPSKKDEEVEEEDEEVDIKAANELYEG